MTCRRRQLIYKVGESFTYINDYSDYHKNIYTLTLTSKPGESPIVRLNKIGGHWRVGRPVINPLHITEREFFDIAGSEPENFKKIKSK